MKGGRNHLADFPEKGLTDFALTTGEIFQLDIWRIKNNYELRYDYKLHCMRYISDVEKLK